MRNGLPFRILVAEDDEDDRIFIDEAFLHIGYGSDVKKFKDGKMLLDYLAQIGPAQYPSLIVLDNNLPGLDATAMLHILKGQGEFQDIRIVVYSTMLTSTVTDKLLAAGAYACMEKGTTFEAVVQLVKELKTIAEEAVKEH